MTAPILPNNLTDFQFTPHLTGKFLDITGRRFGNLTVLGFVGQAKQSYKWLCQCDCGQYKAIDGNSIRNGRTLSCGCLRIVRHLEVCSTHGETRGGKTSGEYTSYQSAKYRCINDSAAAYHRYGGRGIEFRFNSFEEFLEEVGRRPRPDYTIERIDNDGHYEKGNVRWATRAEQSMNTSNCRLITIGNETLNTKQWALKMNISPNTIRARLHDGWCETCSVLLPLKVKCPHIERYVNHKNKKIR